MNTDNSPYSVKPDTKNIKFDFDPSDQLHKYKEDEAQQKADLILPHEMTNIIKFLSDTFGSLAEIHGILLAAGNNGEINKHVLDTITNKIDKVNEIVLDIPKDLAKIGI